MTSRFSISGGMAMLLVACAAANAIRAGEDVAPLPNLTLANFFSDGWSEEWAKRPNPDGAPDMAMLRVQTNFLEREFRTDGYYQRDVNSRKTGEVGFADALVAYGLNRRFMLSVTSNYEWIDSRTGRNSSGSSVALGGRVQLVDVPGSSYALNLRVLTPNGAVAGDRTTTSCALAGWEDLSPLGWSRTGLYFHVQPQTYVGPAATGAKRNDVTCDVSLARTWTRPDATWGNFTTFAEVFGQTDLDGEKSGKTVVTVTPGIRTLVMRHQVLMMGVDLPVSHPKPYAESFRLTYIVNF